jgi:hypothetical protein
VNSHKLAEVPKSQVAMAILWPAFLMACVSSGVVFSLIDPEQLVVLDQQFHVSNLGMYTLGFLLFWLLGCVASGLTAVLMLEWHSRQNPAPR